jgi:poly-beta-1,6-N-acetyl-D-glucosamine synthase
MTLTKYVLITPARNESQFIELTISSVVAQRVRPLKWIIVSDGSTDGTDEIVKRYSAKFPWIELIRMPERKERNFAGKVHAFTAGWNKVIGLEFEVIVCLDGDVSFEEDYFEFLLVKLNEDPALGVVGTPFKDPSIKAYNYRFVGIEHVSGACQVFRRRCFEAIGGYVPVRGGSIDHIAVITARMNGWKTRTFTEKTYDHHRIMGTASGNVIKARFKYGIKDYAIGNHPLWELFRSAYQMSHRPFIIGGIMMEAGYLWSAFRRTVRPVSHEFVAFHRREQMARLRNLLIPSKANDTASF